MRYLMYERSSEGWLEQHPRFHKQYALELLQLHELGRAVVRLVPPMAAGPLRPPLGPSAQQGQPCLGLV